MATPNIELYTSIQQLIDGNMELPPTIDESVTCMIQGQKERQPDAQAVCAWDGSLTYSELDDLSSRLASYLADQGVSTEVFVPVCFEKSKWTVVAVLAVLKAGGAFVLLDPSLPNARLEAIVRQIDATLALSSKACLETCRYLVKRVLVVDDSTIPKLDTPLLVSVDPHDAAYIMFTSGSTGTPKGVVVEHMNLSNTAVYSGRAMGYGNDSRNFQFASHAFDPIITDIFATLVHGGTICIPSNWERENDTVGAMQRMNITHLRLTPSLVGNLIIEDVPTLNTMILGGEVTPTPLIREWSRKLRLVLVYGPAECCVICFSSDISTHEPVPGEIGRPFSARGWVVKQGNHNELAALGDIGELLIEGPTVSRGYLKDPEKTAQVFIRDLPWRPTCKDTQRKYRLYRTGDLARQLDDGRFVYAGRADNQVKIRGQRLELEEVEKHLQNALGQLPSIETSQAIVQAIEFPGTTSKHLVAFLCLGSSEPIGDFDWDSSDSPILKTSIDEQNRFATLTLRIEDILKTTLPAFAVPSIWVPLRHLPLTISKKVDRRLLHNKAATLSIKQLSVFINPVSTTPKEHHRELTRTEIKIQKLWASLFQMETSEIEPHDHFLALGGDSVLAIKLVAAARSIGLDMNLEIIFKNPILRDMARVTKDLESQSESMSELPAFALLGSAQDVDQVIGEAIRECGISKDCIEDIYPCSPMQEGLIASSIRDQGTYILQQVYEIPESTDLDKLKGTWTTVAERTPVMRTRFFDYNSNLLQAVVKEPLKWKVVEGDLAALMATEKMQTVDPKETLSSIAVSLDRASGQTHLVWTVHHALLDGWAESDIATSVEQEYFQKLRTAQNPPGFKHFIRYIRTQDEHNARDFWEKQLAGVSDPVFPPLPKPSYMPKVEHSNRIVDHLDSHADAELEHKVPRLKGGIATPATMIQAAWALLLGLYSNSSDVVTGVTLNGRAAPLAGIDRILGPTITTIPFRSRFRTDQKILDFVHDVQDKYLAILPFAQFGLQNIRRLSDDAVAACKFRTLLIVQSAQRSHSEREILKGRGYAFPVMEFAIVMECEVLEESIDFRATFDNQVVSETQLRRMLQQLEDIVYKISISDSSTLISDIMKASEADIMQIRKWNSLPEVLTPAAASLDELLDRSCEQGIASAVCAWDGTLSYKQLKDYYTRLAFHLQRAYNVKPGSMVFVCFDKSMWAIVSLLATIKAGATCIPINPKDISEKIQVMASRPKKDPVNLIITSPYYVERLNLEGYRVLSFGQDTANNLMGGKVEDVITPEDTAFVVFKQEHSKPPVPISISHRAFCSGLLAWIGFSQQNAAARVLQYFDYAYHLSLTEIFATLLGGGCICVPRESDRTHNLSKAIRELNATHLYLSPEIASGIMSRDVPNVEVIVVIGHSTKHLIESWTGQAKIFHAYGPAEYGTICMSKADIQKQDHNNIGIGLNSKAWVINPDDPSTLVPIGAVGELVIETNISQSYIEDDPINSPLIENPIWAQKNEMSLVDRRFFRTGDLVSYNSDGSFRLFGHKADITKLKGQYLDLSEIEHGLKSFLPLSWRVTVTIANLRDTDQVLVAFVLLNGSSQSEDNNSFIEDSIEVLDVFRDTMNDIELKLQSSIPKHMMPSLYIPIQDFPLTVTANIDYNSLRQSISQFTYSDLLRLRGSKLISQMSRPPETKMEKLIAQLWESLLETNNIRAEDNFFELGGGSVLAMRLVSMARREGLIMTVSSIFKTQTLRELALTVKEKTTYDEIHPFELISKLDVADLRSQAARQCNVAEDEIQDIYPCYNFQLHYILGYPEAHKDPTSEPWCWQSQVVYYLPPSLNIERFKDVWQSAIRRFENLRTRVIHTKHGILQVVLSQFEPLKWTETNDLEVYLKSDQANSMTFGDPLLRLAIVRPTDSSDRFFVMTVQHVIYDAFARIMLFKELETAYLTGAFPEQAPSKMSRFVKYMLEADKVAATNFWTSYLAGAKTAPLLKGVGKCGLAQLSEEIAEMSVPDLHRSEVTLATILEVAGGLAIAKRLDCADVILYSDRSGRNLPVEGIEDLIACTTMFLPVRIHVDRAQTVQDLLRGAQKFQSIAMPHEHLGWLELRDMDHLKATLAHSVNMNINPYPTGLVGRGLGLEVRSTHLPCDDPFGINIDILDGKLIWAIYYDLEFIEQRTVVGLLADLQRVFLDLVHACKQRPGMTVGELLNL
ncbi:hypothetical protein F4810DRAFT_709140 [Camillea tinctor]|nr:hypothetical protein F4810DRAFT_709140 [Camillea tinctor]